MHPDSFDDPIDIEVEYGPNADTNDGAEATRETVKMTASQTCPFCNHHVDFVLKQNQG
jgi:hypothetical protein